MEQQSPRIVVVGSINMDLVIRCQELPQPGQTILAEESLEICGGKGANQAVAAARAGGRVSMVGCVGDDAFAARLSANLASESIDCSHIRVCDRCGSGLAVVGVDSHGENSIYVVPNANARLKPTDVHAAAKQIESSDVMLVQLEVPLDAVLAAIRLARDAGVKVILDPAPVPDDWPDELLQVDLICPNESEAAALTGMPVTTPTEAIQAALALRQTGTKHVVITLGADGVVLSDDQQVTHIEARKVAAVDSTAAGDAFAGALAVRWAETGDLQQATRFAAAAGAIAASRPGAQPSIATRREIESNVALGDAN